MLISVWFSMINYFVDVIKMKSLLDLLNKFNNFLINIIYIYLSLRFEKRKKMRKEGIIPD